jgi:hypothetical protein
MSQADRYGSGHTRTRRNDRNTAGQPASVRMHLPPCAPADASVSSRGVPGDVRGCAASPPPPVTPAPPPAAAPASPPKAARASSAASGPAGATAADAAAAATAAAAAPCAGAPPAAPARAAPMRDATSGAFSGVAVGVPASPMDYFTIIIISYFWSCAGAVQRFMLLAKGKKKQKHLFHLTLKRKNLVSHLLPQQRPYSAPACIAVSLRSPRGPAAVQSQSRTAGNDTCCASDAARPAAPPGTVRQAARSPANAQRQATLQRTVQKVRYHRASRAPRPCKGKPGRKRRRRTRCRERGARACGRRPRAAARGAAGAGAAGQAAQVLAHPRLLYVQRAHKGCRRARARVPVMPGVMSVEAAMLMLKGGQ